jgi:anti-anti-sigma regulatory factor
VPVSGGRQRLVVKLPDEIDVTDDGQDHDTLVLGGDIDEDSYSALIEALNHVPRNGAALCVDLTAVTFCDLAGLWAIVRLAEGAALVILHGVPGPLRAVMEILGWDEQPGLVISQAQHGMPVEACAWAGPPAGKAD